MESDLASLQRAVTVVLNLSFAVLVGASAATLWLRAGTSSWVTGLLPRLRTAVLGATGSAMLAYVAILWVEAASMAEVPLAEALPAVRSVITATHYGMAWMIGAAALIVIGAVCTARDQRGKPASMIRIAAIGVLLYSRSMVSHAGAGGDFIWAVAFDWVHLVLISLWVGEVLVAGLIALPGGPGTELQSRRDCADYIAALSHSATIALVGIFTTGIIAAWRGLGGFDNAFGNPYAATLLVKIGLVLCASALGGLNRFVVMPAMLSRLRKASKRAKTGGDRKAGNGNEASTLIAAESSPDRRFVLILRAEAVFLIAAIVAAAFLSSTPPPTAS